MGNFSIQTEKVFTWNLKLKIITVVMYLWEKRRIPRGKKRWNMQQCFWYKLMDKHSKYFKAQWVKSQTAPLITNKTIPMKERADLKSTWTSEYWKSNTDNTAQFTFFFVAENLNSTFFFTCEFNRLCVQGENTVVTNCAVFVIYDVLVTPQVY